MERLRLVIVSAVLLAAGCWFNFYEVEEPEMRGWPAGAIDTVDVSSDNGTVKVAAAGDTAVAVLITRRCRGVSRSEASSRLADISVTDSLGGRTLYMRVRVPVPNDRSYAADLEISAPGATVLRLHAANGPVSLVNTAGFATVLANNGAVTVTGHSGGIDITANNGIASCDVASLGAGDTVSVHSDNGAATLAIPGDASAGFLVSTGNGAAYVQGFSDVRFSVNEPKLKRGTLGSGAADLTVTASNGQARLKAR